MTNLPEVSSDEVRALVIEVLSAGRLSRIKKLEAKLSQIVPKLDSLDRAFISESCLEAANAWGEIHMLMRSEMDRRKLLLNKPRE